MSPDLLGLLIALGGPPVIAYGAARPAGRSQSLAAGLIAQGALVGLLAAIVVLVLEWEGQSLSSLGLSIFGWSTIGWAVGLTALFIFGLGPRLMRLPAWLGRPGFAKPLATLHRQPLWYLVLAVIIGGTVEEVLYRGYALNHLAVLLDSMWLAAGIVVVLFGLAHVPVWGPAPALAITISGAVLTAAFIVHGDLWANILAHIAVDSAGIVLPAWRARRRPHGSDQSA